MPDLTAQIMAGIFLGLVYRKTGSLFPGGTRDWPKGRDLRSGHLW
ncbi:MAG: hypothetical protein NTV61_03440 [Candidatus Bathyarchaeota archaeon]|nr:hypothetical protein [Candidatus Bathyarchaeota archaeon]